MGRNRTVPRFVSLLAHMPPLTVRAMGIAVALTAVMLSILSRDLPHTTMDGAIVTDKRGESPVAAAPFQTITEDRATDHTLLPTTLLQDGSIPATLAPWRHVKRRRKYSAHEKPRELPTLPGYGAVCADRLVQQDITAGDASNRQRQLDCLPPPGASDAARCIAARREHVLHHLDANNWTVEVWYMAGREGYLNVTSRYMQATLRLYGGIAERVVWLYEEGQPYVPRFAVQEYRSLVESGSFELVVRGNIRRMYRRSLQRPRTIVVKIDDDTVFVQEHSVTALVEELLRPSSRCLVVSANVVNHVGLNPVHFHMGALRVTLAAGASPRSVRDHRIAYDGYQRNVLGSFQELVEWRESHVSFLRALKGDRLSDAYRFHAGTASCPGQGGIFDFQCDGMWRRWGINFIAFPALSPEHFGAMRDLGHLVKNKDEVYFSMEMGRHSASARNRTCAVADALVVHYLNTGQSSNIMKMLHARLPNETAHKRDASLLAPRLLHVYREVAEHAAGIRKCCRRTGCSLFTEPWDHDSNWFLPLP